MDVTLGVDVGGTFTDAVLLTPAGLFSAKTPSTPADQSVGVLTAVEQVATKAGISLSEVASFAHGMTVTTNALLEGKVARTALIATRGFTDIIEIGRQTRPDLYRLCTPNPQPLTPPELRLGVNERTTPSGVELPLDEDEIERICDRVAEFKVEAVAVVLLHSYLHPQHELLLGEALRQRFPQLHISLSHEVVGTFREFERGATTEINAATSPLLATYLSNLEQKCQTVELVAPEIMQSSGGLTDIESASKLGASTLLSGPSGGVAGARIVAQASGYNDLLCFDMGGTSCDVCVVSLDRYNETAIREIDGRPLALPSLDIHTVGSGGGSIAWIDSVGVIKVGPDSAGADPGPACYGNGGADATVTDANLFLGYLSAGTVLAGDTQLDLAASTAVIEKLAASAGLTPTECAEGIRKIVNAEMVEALRTVTVARGVDPRSLALLAFGGAGPMHATQVAEELGIQTVLCPQTSGVLSALGLVGAGRRRDQAKTLIVPLEQIDPDELAAEIAQLIERASSQLNANPDQIQCIFELRYKGQAFELVVEGSAQPNLDDLRKAFEAEHISQYGYAEQAQTVELVTIRVSVKTGPPTLTLSPPTHATHNEHQRPVIFSGEKMNATVYVGQLPSDLQLEGPAILEQPEATVVIPPSWSGQVDQTGTIILRKSDHV